MSEPETRGLTRRIVRWFVSFYYPRIEFENQELIPQSGPVLICANHANSLLDPVILGITARRPVRFMAKAPLFDHPILGPPMKALGMIPAYRGSDDKKDVRKNLESLDDAASALVDGEAMGIFPEGKSTDDTHLEMIRSGAARMALSAFDSGATELRIVPVGLCYEAKERFRSAVLVRVAEPIVVAEILEQEPEERKARRRITDELGKRLKQVVIHLEEPAWEPWLEDLEVLVAPAAGEKNTPVARLQRRKWLADAMNRIWQQDEKRAREVAEEIRLFRESAREVGVPVHSAVLRLRRWRLFARLAVEMIYLALLILPVAAGTLFHLLPFFVVRLGAKALDQPGKKTISTNRMLVGAPVYLLWYLGTALLLWQQHSALPAVVCLLLGPLLGVVTWHYWWNARRIGLLVRQQTRALFRGKRWTQLCEHRVRLVERLAAIAEEER